MSLPEMRVRVTFPAVISKLLDELLEKKEATKEVGKAPRNTVLDAFIESELVKARHEAPPASKMPAQVRNQAEGLFRRTLEAKF